MRRVVIVQARHNASRLPGKVLRDIGGRPMLERVLRRVARAKLVDEVVLATSLGSDDDPVFDLAQKLGLRTIRGSEIDVLSRYVLAAESCHAEVVIRVTADCPLIDPSLVDDVIAAFVEGAAESSRADVGSAWAWDFAANTLERTYPRGLDVEVTHRDALRVADVEAREPYQRAHVMPFFYQNPDRFRLRSVRGETDLSAHRWTVDTDEDLAVVRKIYEALGNEDTFSWREVMALVRARPELEQENSAIAQKALERG